MVETEPTGARKTWWRIGPGKEISRKRLTILCLVLFLYSKMSMIHPSISQLFQVFHIWERYFRNFFASVRNDVVSRVTTKCAKFSV